MCLESLLRSRHELHHGLEMDRTSCTSFLTNQLRVLLTAAAYVLMQQLRLSAGRGDRATAQVSTLRKRLLMLDILGSAPCAQLPRFALPNRVRSRRLPGIASPR